MDNLALQIDDENEVESGFTVPDQLPETQENKDDSHLESAQNLPQEESNAAPPPSRERKHNKNSFKERIGKLVHENKNKDYINLTLKQQLEEKERLLFLKEEQLRQKDALNVQLFETNKQTEESSILRALKQATEEGDVEQQVKYQSDLSRIKAEQAAFDVLKLQQQQYQQNQTPANYPYREETTFYPDLGHESQTMESEPELADEYVDFLERNRWADPSSSNYSQRLRKEADEIADEFNETLKFNNQAHLIGTHEYFNAIEGLMRERYASNSSAPSQDYYQQEEQSPTYQAPPPAPTAGVSRRGATMADQYIAKNPHQMNRAHSLTEQELKWARNMKIPNGPVGSNQFMTGDKVAQEWAKNKAYFDKNPIDTNRQFASTKWGFSVSD